MIWLAIIIMFAIQNWIDAGILLGIQFVNSTLGWCASAPPATLTQLLHGSSACFLPAAASC